MHVLVETIVKKFYEDAQLLENMAAVYPGDMTGNMSEEAFILRYCAETLEDLKWNEILGEYEDSRPVIEVTTSGD